MASRKNAREYPIQIIREQLRQRSVQQTALLSRSVGRMTSYDVQPCPEYRDEIERERGIIDKLIYLQRCRCSLEKCIGSGAARLRYRWQNGNVTETSFRKVAPGRIRVNGLLAETALPLAG